MKKILIILIIFLTTTLLIYNQEKIMKHYYEKRYMIDVEKYAEKFEVDEHLIYAIMKIESGFNKDAKSSKDAIGLMQIQEATAKEVLTELEIEYTGIDMLYEPETNIMIGTKYISKLIKQYDNYIIALAAYNAGMGNVNKWIETGIIKEDGSDIENIPYKETNMYVRKIKRDYQIYKILYNKGE